MDLMKKIGTYKEEKSINDGHFGHCIMEIFMNGMVQNS
jgi:hypothetical protein